MGKEREEGYYWVKTGDNSGWTMADFECGNWYFFGIEERFSDNDLFEIDENEIKHV